MNIQFNTHLSNTMDSHILDAIYNHKSICETLLKEGYHKASLLFHQRSKHLTNLSIQELSILRCVFLSSLNKSLYTFVLFAWDISLAECCFRNIRHSHAYEDEQTFLKAGDSILYSYATQIETACPKANHIERACNYIENHLQDELTLDIVAQNTYISKSYLSQTFKLFTGESFSDYITNHRITLAKNLLLTTDFKIDYIATQCGFFSSTYFSTVFRKKTELSPSEFRKRFSGTAYHHLAIS